VLAKKRFACPFFFVFSLPLSAVLRNQFCHGFRENPIFIGGGADERSAICGD
jgi:hypothetical protein